MPACHCHRSVTMWLAITRSGKQPALSHDTHLCLRPVLQQPSGCTLLPLRLPVLQRRAWQRVPGPREAAAGPAAVAAAVLHPLSGPGTCQAGLGTVGTACSSQDTRMAAGQPNGLCEAARGDDALACCASNHGRWCDMVCNQATHLRCPTTWLASAASLSAGAPGAALASSAPLR